MTYIDEIVNYGIPSDTPSDYIVVINSLITITILAMYFINLETGITITIILSCIFLISAFYKRNLQAKHLLISAANFAILAAVILILQL